MLKARIAHVKNQYQRIYESMGQSMESVIDSFGGEEEFNNKISEIVKMDLKGIIAFHNIAEKEKIEFSDEEIEEYKKKLQSEGMPIDGISKAEILDRMIGEKVVEFLVSKVKFVDKVDDSGYEADDERERESEENEDISDGKVSKDDEHENIPASKIKENVDVSDVETDVEVQ